MRETALRLLRLRKLPLEAWHGSTHWLRYREDLEDVRNFLVFIGYPRSGHSLLGAMLNAHPDAVIAHELDAAHFVRCGFTREQIYGLLLWRDRWFQRQGSEWTGYKYGVPDQWQGRYRRLQVIGDKKGGRTSTRLVNDPALLEKIRARVRDPIRVIHQCRNPFDNITTWSRRKEITLEQAAQGYFELAIANQRARASLDSRELYELRHEDLIADPRLCLSGIAEFLDLDVDEEWVEACAGIVFDRPKKTRADQRWPAPLVDSVTERLQAFTFLRSYSYNG